MFQNIPRILLAAAKEQQIIKKWISEFQLAGIISDSRMVVYNKNSRSVYITRQLPPLAVQTTYFSQKFIKKSVLN
jgi:hypothetical protein